MAPCFSSSYQPLLIARRRLISLSRSRVAARQSPRWCLNTAACASLPPYCAVQHTFSVTHMHAGQSGTEIAILPLCPHPGIQCTHAPSALPPGLRHIGMTDDRCLMQAAGHNVQLCGRRKVPGRVWMTARGGARNDRIFDGTLMTHSLDTYLSWQQCEGQGGGSMQWLPPGARACCPWPRTWP